MMSARLTALSGHKKRKDLRVVVEERGGRRAVGSKVICTFALS